MRSVHLQATFRHVSTHACRGILLLVAVIAAGCAGSRQMTVDVPATSADAQNLSDRLRREVRTWEGTPHRWGGESRAGADCSGFVMRVFDDVFGLSLPRTTEDQAREGREVSARSLVPGDLVFFRTAPKTRHVGIYLSDGEFAHASTSDGVRISRLDEAYWQRTYWMSRRVLDVRETMISDAPTNDPENAVEPRADARARTVRTGW